MDDDRGAQNKLNQLISITLAQDAIVLTLVGRLAIGSGDWREFLEGIRLMAEAHVKNFVWDGSVEEGKIIHSLALEHFQSSFDSLHRALVESEKAGFNPKPPRGWSK